MRTFNQHSFQVLAQGNDEIIAGVERLEWLLRHPGEEPPPPPSGPVTLEIPEHLDYRLDVAIRKALDPEYLEPRRFPLRLGVNGFTYHFLECTARAAPDNESEESTALKSYLSLMQSIFILKRIKEGDEHDRKVKRRADPMWIIFMRELEEVW